MYTHIFLLFFVYTVPTLTISLDFLVAQVGEVVQVTCTPSDPTAPVQWTSQFGDLGDDNTRVVFSPSSLNHNAEFSAIRPSYLTEVYICDLINVENPGEDVDPQNVTVRFTSGAYIVTIRGGSLGLL